MCIFYRKDNGNIDDEHQSNPSTPSSLPPSSPTLFNNEEGGNISDENLFQSNWFELSNSDYRDYSLALKLALLGANPNSK